jgi:hypothetical protein
MSEGQRRSSERVVAGQGESSKLYSSTSFGYVQI